MTVPELFGFRIGTNQQHAGDGQSTTHGGPRSTSTAILEELRVQRKLILPYWLLRLLGWTCFKAAEYFLLDILGNSLSVHFLSH